VKNFVNKDSTKFLLQFVLIIGASLAVVFAVGFYTAGDELDRVELAAPTDE